MQECTAGRTDAAQTRKKQLRRQTMKDVGKILIYTVSEKLVESFQVRSFQNKLFKEA